MNILLIGSGGREHALAKKMTESALLNKLYIAPGNAGTDSCGENVHLNVSDFSTLKAFLLSKKIDLVVVGPEAPLVDGIADKIDADSNLNVSVIGPKRKGAHLEGSKEYAKAFMQKHKIPTAKYQSFTINTIKEGEAFLDTLKPPYVLKADGLAAGKGVLILDDLAKAKAELKDMFSGKFGEAGNTVVIEEFLDGIELSVFILTDGEGYIILPEAKDYKRIGEGDTGLNTGGMGAVSPVGFAQGAFLSKVEERIVKPTINGFKQDGFDYVGFVFIGLMSIDGNPFVIEYNVRMGDPEAEVVIPRIKSDLVDIFKQTANKNLSNYNLELDPRTAVTVMAVSGGYPEGYQKGKEITGLKEGEQETFFHAGTTLKDGKIITSGGRVISCTAFGNNVNETKTKALAMAEQIKFEGKYYRKDIGMDLL